jgi:hypothetical protein
MRNTVPVNIAIPPGSNKGKTPNIKVDQFVVNALQFKASKGCSIEELVHEYLGLASEDKCLTEPASKAITARVKELKDSGAAVAKDGRIYWYRYAK